MKTITHKVSLCVIGGGLAGMCTAISAARQGISTLIMQERPVFGGNASSEIRMWVCGARNCLETGLIEEIRLENQYRNTQINYSVWDSILFEKVRFQENLESLLNCSCLQAETENGVIRSVTGWQMTTQTYHKVEADFFADCSGDSIVALLSGAEVRKGRESSGEFNESLAPEEADSKTMGLSCLLQAREMTTPQKYIPPAWANKYPDEDSFPQRGHDLNKIQNFWYLELGGDQDSVADTETLRDELLKVAFGFWDHIKNHGDHGAENWMLDWVGFLPGKRESYRCMGDYILTQKDLFEPGEMEDICAYGGWPMDDHHPGGFHHFGPANTNIYPPKPYPIPMRSLYSRNIPNLLFAGRNISCTHTGLSSTRVMATCAILGQAVGVMAAYAVKNNLSSIRETCQKYCKEIQQTLMEEDCYLPGLVRAIPALSREASLTVSSGNGEMLRNGIDRALGEESNAWSCKAGDYAQYSFKEATPLKEVRLVFDSDLKRNHLNTVANYFLDQKDFQVPDTLVKAFHLEADGKVIYECTNNYQRLVKIPLENIKVRSLRLVIDSLRKEESAVFAFDVR